MADLVLERFQRFRYLDGPRSQPPLSLADNSVADVLAIPFPDFVMCFKGEVALMDDDDHAVLESQKAAGLGLKLPRFGGRLLA